MPTITFTRALERFLEAPSVEAEGATLDAALAAVFAERIRSGLRSVGVQKSDGRPAPFGLSVSVGIADHTLEGPKEDPDALLKAADAALYEAKREGRDRVVVFGRPVISPPVQRH